MPPTSQKDLGRSAPRSRNGCVRCKQRRVRCDQSRPSCGNCQRMKCDCEYAPVAPRRRRATVSSGTSGASPQRSSTSTARSLGATIDASPSDRYIPTASIGKPTSGPDSQENASSSFPPMTFPQPQQQTPPSQGVVLASPSTSDQSLQMNDNTFNSSNDAEYTFSQVDNLAYHIPSASYSSDFDNFFSMPNLASFPTFEFSDSGGRQDHEVARLISNIEGMSTPREGGSAFLPNTFCPVQGQNDVLSSASRLSIDKDRPETLKDSSVLRPEATAVLLSYFKSRVRLPASLIPTDSFGWYQMQRYLLRVASKCSMVKKALLALTQLFSVHEITSKSFNSADWKIAFDLQTSSCKELRSELAKGNSSDNIHDALLATVFLLAWFEILCDDQDTHRSMFPNDLAETVITSGKSWSSNSRRLLHWLNSFDAKASHLGGRQLLSPRSLEVVFQHRFDTSSRAGDSEHSDTEDSQSICPPTRASTVEVGNTTRSSQCKDTPSVPGIRHHAPDISKLKMDVFHAIIQPALEFHLVSQSFSRRIGSHDRHHRPRNTVDDEYEVVTACKGFEIELKKLWRQRPQIMDLSAAQLSEILHPDIARQLEELFSVYAAGFWTHFIYIHRVAWWSLPHSENAKRAIDETWIVLQRSIGDQGSESSAAYSSPAKDAVIHPGLMWPLFLFGSECTTVYQQEWSVAQLKTLAEAGAAISIPEASGRSMRHSSNKAHSSQNAMRAAILLEEMIKQQNKTQARVDGKYLSLELFGCHFTII